MKRESFGHFIQQQHSMPQEAVTAILDQFEEKWIGKNDYFLKAGRISNEYFFLESGCMRAFTLDTAGDEVTTYFFTDHRVVFEASSFFMRAVSTENIQAITDCSGYSISFEKLNQLFHALPEFREFGRKMLVKEFAAFKQRTLSSINESAEQRYRGLLERQPAILQAAQLRHIASFLGITDTSLSRIRRELAKK
jgi:CRP-like cAMP-binding protein